MLYLEPEPFLGDMYGDFTGDDLDDPPPYEEELLLLLFFTRELCDFLIRSDSGEL